MQKQFAEQMKSLDCLNQRILVAVSGGLDSVVLVHLLKSTGSQLAIAHANFQLRAEESDEDEAFVTRLSRDIGIPLHTRRFDTNNYAMEHGLSIQMAARKLRYEWFDTLMKSAHYERLATGHHLNDNIETVLLHLTRGTGLQGLHGIPERNGYMIRPLLTFTRQELEQYALEKDIRWREDSSNARDDYQRNLIRQQVIPKLKEINPSLEETFKRTLERLHSAGELSKRSLDQFREVHVQQLPHQVRISKTLFSELQFPAPVLLEFIKELGFNLDQCHEMIEVSSGQPGKVFLSSSHQLVVDRDCLIVTSGKSSYPEVFIEEGQQQAVLAQQVLHFKANVLAEINADQDEASMDLEKLRFPLIWRMWRSGDSFVPLGMQHHKKLSDFLIDNKVSVSDKEQVTVLESGGEIAWVVGYRIDDRYKISESTRRVLVCKVSAAAKN